MSRLTSDRGACTVATMPWLAAPLSSSLRVALVPCAACPRKPCAYPIYPCMPDREGLGGSNDPPSVGRRLPSTDVASCRPPCGPAELASLQELSGFRGAVTRGGVRARRGCTGQSAVRALRRGAARGSNADKASLCHGGARALKMNLRKQGVTVPFSGFGASARVAAHLDV